MINDRDLTCMCRDKWWTWVGPEMKDGVVIDGYWKRGREKLPAKSVCKECGCKLGNASIIIPTERN